MLCQSLLYSKMTQFYIYIHSLIFFPLWLIENIGYSSLCYTIGPCCLSILNVIICIYQPHIPSPFPGNHKSDHYACESVSVSWIGSFVPYFRFHIQVTSWYLPFSFWLTSLGVKFYPGSCKRHYFVLFYDLVVFCCVYVPHLFYPFLCWWRLEKAMAPHSSTLAWKIPWMEEPGRLQSMESLRVGHNWATSFSLFTFMHWRRKWQPTPVFLPGESQGQRSLVGCHLWGRTESDTTEVT